MHLLVVGHAGARVLVFPTSHGDHHEWIDRRMHEVLGEHIDQRLDSTVLPGPCHGESWYGEHLHPGARAWRHLQYDRYLHDEVLPFTASPQPQPLRRSPLGRASAPTTPPVSASAIRTW